MVFWFSRERRVAMPWSNNCSCEFEDIPIVLELGCETCDGRLLRPNSERRDFENLPLMNLGGGDARLPQLDVGLQLQLGFIELHAVCLALRDLFVIAAEISENLTFFDEVAARNKQRFKTIRRNPGSEIDNFAARFNSPEGRHGRLLFCGSFCRKLSARRTLGGCPGVRKKHAADNQCQT